MEEGTVYQRIKALLAERGVPYREMHHPPTRTSEESARARGEEMAVGGKALVLMVKGEFRLFVLSAALKLDSRKIKDRFGTRKLRFATREELFELTGLEPGAVPPFGPPVLPFRLHLDPSILRNDRIAFNAGSLTDSILLSVPDYLTLVEPEIFDFSAEAGD